jgi:hypothetical protein
MHKKVLFAGAIAVAGFVTLTAFGAKTLAEQKVEIDNAVKAKLETLRADKTAECDARVEAEAQIRFEAAQAAAAEVEAAAPAKGGKKPAKKPTAKGPKADPLPQVNKPVDPAQAKKDKTSGTVSPNTEEKKAKTGGEAPVINNADKKASKTGGKPTGGGK